MLSRTLLTNVAFFSAFRKLNSRFCSHGGGWFGIVEGQPNIQFIFNTNNATSNLIISIFATGATALPEQNKPGRQDGGFWPPGGTLKVSFTSAEAANHLPEKS